MEVTIELEVTIEFRRLGLPGEPDELVATTTGDDGGRGVIFALNPPIMNLSRGRYEVRVEGYEPFDLHLDQVMDGLHSLNMSGRTAAQ